MEKPHPDWPKVVGVEFNLLGIFRLFWIQASRVSDYTGLFVSMLEVSVDASWGRHRI